MTATVGLDERELELLLEARELLLEFGHELLEVAVVAGRVEVVAQLAPPLRQPVRAFELLHAPPHSRRLAMVVVDGGVAHPLLRLAVGALELLDELFHQAITSTRSAPRVSPFSSSSTSRRARIETSSWSSVGSRVVSRCSQSPGASSFITSRLSVCLPAKRINS